MENTNDQNKENNQQPQLDSNGIFNLNLKFPESNNYINILFQN